MAIVYKIHPAIGTARVGNSSEYYLAPEAPGGLPLDRDTGKPIYSGPGLPPQSVFRDASGALKKQAARFKVYAYDNADPADRGTRVKVGTTKVNGKTVTGIEWTVYLANKKSSWFQFKQLTGSGMQGDGGYQKNNANGAKGNPLRFNKALGTTDDPSTINDAKRKQLVLDPGPHTVSGPKAQAQEFKIVSKGLKPFDITTLGRILTDADCNLIVVGGDGRSGTADTPIEAEDYANNNGWFDDVSDGPVSGALLLQDGSRVAIDAPAWVVCGVPKYAPEVINMVSMYDTMYDVFVREFGLNRHLFNNGFQAGYKPNRASEIVPLLSRPNLYRYIAQMGFGVGRHAALPTQTAQQFAASSLLRIRAAGQTNAGPTLMPKLAGDNPLSDAQRSNFLTLTQTQFFILKQFAANQFSDVPPPAMGEGVALDQASLENCVGGAFCPGIEITWICRNKTIYMPLPAKSSLSDAFRIRHKNLGGAGLTLTNGADNDYSGGLEPGDLTKYMAQPWQADFNECSDQPIPKNGPNYWWWPAQRPYKVFAAQNPAQQVFWTRTSEQPNGDQFEENLQMVVNWKDLGFILDIGAAGSPQFVEIERNENAISNFKPPLTS